MYIFHELVNVGVRFYLILRHNVQECRIINFLGFWIYFLYKIFYEENSISFSHWKPHLSSNYSGLLSSFRCQNYTPEILKGPRIKRHQWSLKRVKSLRSKHNKKREMLSKRHLEGDWSQRSVNTRPATLAFWCLYFFLGPPLSSRM